MVFILFASEFDLFSSLFAGLHAWQIKGNKLKNKGTGLEYSYDASKQGYCLGDTIIEERYIEAYLQTAQDPFCQEDHETFKIKCSTSGSFLRAKSHYDKNKIIPG